MTLMVVLANICKEARKKIWFLQRQGYIKKYFFLIVLREKEFCILINLQRRKNTYIYSSVRAKRNKVRV